MSDSSSRKVRTTQVSLIIMQQLPQEHSDPEEEQEIEEEIWFTVPKNMVGYAIGKNGQTKNRIMEKTNTYIKTKRIEEEGKETTYFIIRGKRENQYSAKLFIKETVNGGIRRSLGLETVRFPVIDSSSGEFELKRVSSTDDDRTHKTLFKIDLRDSSGDIVENKDYSFLSDQLSKTLQKNKETNRASKIWCHFGHIYIMKVQPDEEDNVYSPEDLNNHLLPKWFSRGDIPETTKWQYKFFDYVRNEDENTIFNQLQRWMSNQRETSLDLTFQRYEFTYLAPSCTEIRIKVFVQVKPHDSDPSKAEYENVPSPVDVKNVLKQSDTYPYFYICESTAKRAVVDILEPSGPDIRLIAEANLTAGPEDDDLRNEVEILYKYVRGNLIITPDGKVDLLQENVPEDYDLRYSRISERKLYTVTTDDDEQFDVIVCYESPRDIKKGNYNETKNSVDIHLLYHEWEDKFKTNSWDPQEIVDKIPRFMACARSLARSLVADATTPPEILARGPKARRAYQEALKSGKTKNLRVPVMLVGQSRVGKTSLLRSLMREKFDPNEDSTEGAKLYRSVFKAEDEVWKEDEATENTFNECAAKAVAQQLTALASGTESTESSSEEEDDNLNLPTTEENVHQNLDIPIAEKREADNFSDDTKEQGSPQSEAIELKSQLPQQAQQTAPENSPLPEEVMQKTTYMLQNLGTVEKDENIHFITMDFAGQPVYQATHPVFLSPKGIYILVHSLKDDAHALATPMVKQGYQEPRKIDDNCPMTNMDHLEFWLSFVASNAATTDLSQHGMRKGPRKFPPVFLVCTHADEPFGKQDPEEVSQKILKHLKEENPSPGQHLVHDIYPVDNTVSGSRAKEENQCVRKLRKDIEVTAEHLPQVGEVIPIRWLKFERELTEIVQKRYITLEEAKKIAFECKIDLESDELETLLNYLHDLKVIIYFEHTNVVIIDTQWLLDMFVKVITVKPYLDWEPRFNEVFWRKLENEGVLEKKLVEHVWSDLKDEKNTIDGLLTVMEKFSLLCRWRCLNGPEVFLVPAMLVNSVPRKLLTDPQYPVPLVVRFSRAHLPLGIFPRMLVTIAEFCNTTWPRSRTPEFSRNFCRFWDVGENNCSLDLLVTSDMSTITVGISTHPDAKKNWDQVVDFCQMIKGFLFKALKKMQTDCPWMKTMDFEFGIRCPICSKSTRPCSRHETIACMRDTCTHFIPENELPRCYKDPTNATSYIDEKSYIHWFPKTAKVSIQPKSVETVGLESASRTPAPSAVSCQELMVYSGNTTSIEAIDAEATASKVAGLLQLDKSSMDDPPADIMEKCKELCSWLKSNKRHDIVKKMKEKLPSGMTVPLGDGNLLVKDMDHLLKQKVSRALSAKDEWKAFAENVGVMKDDIEYYNARAKNPVLDILDEHCQNMTLDELYVCMVGSGVSAIADNYL